ncbi:MAG TPA: flavodoxin-dependent (E)-4-hydroxy-3-methylbut-2-enyl-diphosphate synthase, partial [Opitutaceae bacterium]
ALSATAAQLATPRLNDTPAEGLLVPVATPADLAALQAGTAALPVSFLALELTHDLTPADVGPLLQSSRGAVILVRTFTAHDAAPLHDFAQLVRRHGQFLAVATTATDLTALTPTLQALGDDHLVFTLNSQPSTLDSPTHSVGAYRALAEALRSAGSRAPLWIRNTAATTVRGDPSFLSKLLDASILTGALLCDGLGDLVSIETEADAVRATKLAYNVLQGAGARISKTEFVACPSCGRTLFDLQTTTQRIREKTGHLKGVKLAIMGCIVNGPGEMADADFGYVGGAPGKINLYVGKTCVQYNIPQAEADDRLIALIKAHGKWVDPVPVAAP